MKTGRKWKTNKCGRCGNPHNGYSGKLDSDGVEYVVCGVTNKRMNVDIYESDKKEPYENGGIVREIAFFTIWEKE